MSKDSANNSEEKQAEQIISTWDSLALAYDRLLEKHSIFSVMASRLIELANATSCESVMDLAGGSGLLSKMLLSASTKTKIYFVEPAPQMMTLAKQQLDPAQTIFYQAKATEIDKFNLKVDAILSNAAMHLVDLAKVFKSVSTVLYQFAIHN